MPDQVSLFDAKSHESPDPITFMVGQKTGSKRLIAAITGADGLGREIQGRTLWVAPPGRCARGDALPCYHKESISQTGNIHHPAVVFGKTAAGAIMDNVIFQRVQMATIGALAGLCFYGLGQIVDRDTLSERGFLALVVFATTFFTGLLALTGPLSLLRAAVATLALASVTTVLFLWASFRFETVDNFFFGPFPVLAAMIVGTVPLPFIVAAFGPGWRDYPALFSAAWTIVVRYAAAWVFVAVVWGVIYLSDMLLSIVGLTVIKDLIAQKVVPFLVTGLTLGLALAVVQEMKDFVSPYLILRLLRLLLPVVLVVMVVFVAALPVQGLSGLFGGLSVAATLLCMTAAAATLITTAIDQSDGEATQSPMLARATQALAVILPIPAGLAAYSIWLRVHQYGWTPDRLFAALMAALALGYAVLYAAAVIRRAGWMARIRQGNIVMAVAGVAAAALWLTPLLNAERISANSLVSMYQSGATSVADLDLRQLDALGYAGSDARATLDLLSKEPGQDALATALASADTYDADAPIADPAKVLAGLTAILPVQPASATAERDRLLASVDGYQLASWLAACRIALPDGKPGCAMVVADFTQSYPGNEAILVLRDAGLSMQYVALVQAEGGIEQRAVTTLKGYLPYDATGAAIISQMQAGPPDITPAPMNQMTLGNRSLVIVQ